MYGFALDFLRSRVGNSVAHAVNLVGKEIAMNQKYIKKMKERTAYLSIGRSTLRNQGSAGVVGVARSYLKRLNLDDLKGVRSQKAFKLFLDCHTRELSNKFPNRAKRNWGAARKALNIFLRDVSYNTFLSKWYRTEKLLPWLELPLDNDVAEQLFKHRKTHDDLPKRFCIKKLTSDTNDNYQDVATRVAQEENICRVHLDVEYWRQGNY